MSCVELVISYYALTGIYIPDAIWLFSTDEEAKHMKYDLLIGMDEYNMRNMRRMLGGDPEGKVHSLLEYAGRPGQSIADPWYTGNFDETYEDVLAGCTGLLEQLKEKL